MPELDTITVKGFKSIASIEMLKLGAINVLIGPNGSGKSNFIGVFSLLKAICEGQLQDYVARAGGAEKVLHFGSKVTQALEIDVIFSNQTGQYRINLEPTETDRLYPSFEKIQAGRARKSIFLATPDDEARFPRRAEADISDPRNERPARFVLDHVESWRIYHFHDTSASSPLKKTADIHDNRFLRPDGSNLAAFLYFLKVKEETSYSLIRRTVQLVAPFFDDFLLEPQQLNPDKIRLEWRHVGTDAYFDASSLSDGTLRFIGLATLFLQPVKFRPSVILVDEPELGLHPYAITMLASLIKQAATETQVIVSTQSSLLLDHFEPEDVLVTDLVDGATQFTRLESARLATWLEDYSLGQLWEKNEIGGRPGAR
jgi:predicted ATPase